MKQHIILHVQRQHALPGLLTDSTLCMEVAAATAWVHRAMQDIQTLRFCVFDANLLWSLT